MKLQASLLCLSLAAAAAPTPAAAMGGRREAANPAPQAQPPSYDRPGFATRMHKGGLWVFRADSAELASFDAGSVPARHVVRPLAGPDQLTVRSPDGEIITLYLTHRPGFATRLRNERLWVFPEDAPALAAFDETGRVPARHVVRPLAGPMGLTIIAEESEILDAYLAAQ